MHLKRVSEVFGISERKLNLLLYNNFSAYGLYKDFRLHDKIFEVLKDRVSYYKNTSIMPEKSIRSNVVDQMPLTRICGCYFLFDNDEIVYVGQSVNILSRILSHTDKKFNKISYVELDKDDLNVTEMTYIIMLCPKYNSNKHKKINLNEYHIRRAIDYVKNQLDRNMSDDDFNELMKSLSQY